MEFGSSKKVLFTCAIALSIVIIWQLFCWQAPYRWRRLTETETEPNLVHYSPESIYFVRPRNSNGKWFGGGSTSRNSIAVFVLAVGIDAKNEDAAGEIVLQCSKKHADKGSNYLNELLICDQNGNILHRKKLAKNRVSQAVAIGDYLHRAYE